MSDSVYTTVSAGALFALSRTLRRAWLAGRDSVDSRHLLAELAVRIPAVRPLLQPALDDFWSPDFSIAVVSLDEAHQQMILAASLELSDLESVAILREATWLASDKWRMRSGIPAPRWCDDILVATSMALRQAAGYGITRANEAYLLSGVLADAKGTLSRELRRQAIEPAAILEQRAIRSGLSGSGTSSSNMVTELSMWNLLAGRPQSILGRILGVVRPSPGGPLLRLLCIEAVRQAVRLGHRQVLQVHLLLAICALNNELVIDNLRLLDKLAAINSAASLLSQHGVDYRRMFVCAAQMSMSVNLVQSDTLRKNRVADPPAADEFIRGADRAKAEAESNGSGWTGTTHILIALLGFEDGTATKLLRSLGVDVNELMTNATRSAAKGRPHR